MLPRSPLPGNTNPKTAKHQFRLGAKRLACAGGWCVIAGWAAGCGSSLDAACASPVPLVPCGASAAGSWAAVLRLGAGRCDVGPARAGTMRHRPGNGCVASEPGAPWAAAVPQCQPTPSRCRSADRWMAVPGRGAVRLVRWAADWGRGVGARTGGAEWGRGPGARSGGAEWGRGVGARTGGGGKAWVRRLT
jgi:hypothetical protein